MSYRPTTHPHRVTVIVPRSLWAAVLAESVRLNCDPSIVARAAILAAQSYAGPMQSVDNRLEPTERRALRLCEVCAARTVSGPGTAASALRALVADGLTRDWRAQLRRAEMGDAWREDAR